MNETISKHDINNTSIVPIGLRESSLDELKQFFNFTDEAVQDFLKQMEPPIIWDLNKTPKTIKEVLLYIGEKNKNLCPPLYGEYHAIRCIVDCLEKGYDLSDDVSKIEYENDSFKKKPLMAHQQP